jgi:hypothetical protein
MMQREEERQSGGLSPVKYHGKWPFIRASVFQACFVACMFMADTSIQLLHHGYYMSNLFAILLSGAPLNCFVCPQPIDAFHWLAFIFPASELQITY